MSEKFSFLPKKIQEIFSGNKLEKTEQIVFSCKMDIINPLEEFSVINNLCEDYKYSLKAMASSPKKNEISTKEQIDFVICDFFDFDRTFNGDKKSKISNLSKEEINKYMDKNNLTDVTLEETTTAFLKNEEIFKRLHSFATMLYAKDEYAYKYGDKWGEHTSISKGRIFCPTIKNIGDKQVGNYISKFEPFQRNDTFYSSVHFLFKKKEAK